jgi:hypothetical protein
MARTWICTWVRRFSAWAITRFIRVITTAITAAEEVSVSTTGFLLPTARTVDTGSGTWTLDSNILADDGAEATFSLTSKNTSGRWLIGQSFGFDAAIPAGSMIDQVNIRMDYRVNDTGGVANPQLQAFVSGGAVGAVRSADPAEPTTLTENTFDITADRSWTRDDLLDAVFDLRCTGRNGNSTTDPSYRWDYIAVEVVYTAGETPVSDSDSGAGSEAAVLAALLTDSDSGTGGEAGTLAAELSDSDSGTGSEAGSAEEVGGSTPVTDTDTGTGAELAWTNDVTPGSLVIIRAEAGG